MARVQFTLAAARRAYARIDLDLAEALARAAQEAGGGWPADQLRAEALDRNGHYTEAARVLPHPPAGDDVGRAVGRDPGPGPVPGLRPGPVRQSGSFPARPVARPGFGRCGGAWILLFDGRCHDSISVSDAALGCDGIEPDSVVPAAAAATMAATPADTLPTRPFPVPHPARSPHCC